MAHRLVGCLPGALRAQQAGQASNACTALLCYAQKTVREKGVSYSGVRWAPITGIHRTT